MENQTTLYQERPPKENNLCISFSLPPFLHYKTNKGKQARSYISVLYITQNLFCYLSKLFTLQHPLSKGEGPRKHQTGRDYKRSLSYQHSPSESFSLKPHTTPPFFSILVCAFHRFSVSFVSS